MATVLARLFALILRLRRRREAFKPTQQIFFGHAIELDVGAGFNLSLHFGTDHRRRGFRFVALADDNFYPVTLDDLAKAGRRADKSRVEKDDDEVLHEVEGEHRRTERGAQRPVAGTVEKMVLGEVTGEL